MRIVLNPFGFLRKTDPVPHICRCNHDPEVILWPDLDVMPGSFMFLQCGRRFLCQLFIHRLCSYRSRYYGCCVFRVYLLDGLETRTCQQTYCRYDPQASQSRHVYDPLVA